MVKEVIKGDGSREPFDAGKIMRSIETAAREAGLDEIRIQELVKQAGGAAMQLADVKETISTAALKDKILNELDKLEPAVSGAWRRYDESKNK